MSPPVTHDAFGRPLGSLRLSVTDRCNLRCSYCMPEAAYRWLPMAQILTFEEVSSLVDRFIALGVRKVRLTGGEPLVRRDLASLVRLLADKPLEDVALTTNGVLLEAQLADLQAAGLRRLTVSLDTLSAERFERLSHRDSHHRVLAGIDAAARSGLPLKLDTVLIRGVNDDEVLPLLDFAGARGAELRFIEYMDVGGATGWSMAQVVTRQQILDTLQAACGPVVALPGRGNAPAERFRLADGRVFGIIASTTRPFCGACDRVRLTADGQLFTCLYSANGVDLKSPLRAGASAAELEQRIASRWSARTDKGAERRLALRESRGPLASRDELEAAPHLEMHTRGG